MTIGIGLDDTLKLVFEFCRFCEHPKEIEKAIRSFSKWMEFNGFQYMNNNEKRVEELLSEL